MEALLFILGMFSILIVGVIVMHFVENKKDPWDD